MKIQIVIKNSLGEFMGEIMDISEEKYLGLIEVSKKFYMEDSGFEMWTDDGFLVLPPALKYQSILEIKIISHD